MSHGKHRIDLIIVNSLYVTPLMANVLHTYQDDFDKMVATLNALDDVIQSIILKIADIEVHLAEGDDDQLEELLHTLRKHLTALNDLRYTLKVIEWAANGTEPPADILQGFTPGFNPDDPDDDAAEIDEIEP